MAVQHKFYQTNFGDGFQTENAILDRTPYKPEIMVIGTFNPNTPNANFADFFYGRNFFWTAFKNLFIDNEVVLLNRRMPARGVPPVILNPTLSMIKDLCIKLKLTFSDLVLEVLHNNPNYQLLQNDNVIFNEVEYNLIQDGRNRNVDGLQQLNALGQVNWNTQNIINYLCDNPQIKTVYFTRQPRGVWAIQWNLIVNHNFGRALDFRKIFTPSGQGLQGQPRIAHLINHWLFNNNENYDTLDNDWLMRHDIDINVFEIY